MLIDIGEKNLTEMQLNHTEKEAPAGNRRRQMFESRWLQATYEISPKKPVLAAYGIMANWCILRGH